MFRCVDPLGATVTVDAVATARIAAIIRRSFRRDRVALPAYYIALDEQIVHPPRF